MTIGDPDVGDAYMGPVISDGAKRSILGYIEAGKWAWSYSLPVNDDIAAFYAKVPGLANDEPPCNA